MAPSAMVAFSQGCYEGLLSIPLAAFALPLFIVGNLGLWALCQWMDSKRRVDSRSAPWSPIVWVAIAATLVAAHAVPMLPGLLRMAAPLLIVSSLGATAGLLVAIGAAMADTTEGEMLPAHRVSGGGVIGAVATALLLRGWPRAADLPLDMLALAVAGGLAGSLVILCWWRRTWLWSLMACIATAATLLAVDAVSGAAPPSRHAEIPIDVPLLAARLTIVGGLGATAGSFVALGAAIVDPTEGELPSAHRVSAGGALGAVAASLLLPAWPHHHGPVIPIAILLLAVVGGVVGSVVIFYLYAVREHGVRTEVRARTGHSSAPKTRGAARQGAR